MNIELLTIYTLAPDGQSFSQFLVDGLPVKLVEYDAVFERMGSTSLTATLKHPRCLDALWTGREFVVLDEASLQGGVPVGTLEAFMLYHTPSSSKDNTDERYVHTLEFRSRRDIFLSGVYFRDSVAAGSASSAKFSSDNYSVKFVGTLDEFVQRFNDVLSALGLASRFSVSLESAVAGTTESLEITFEKQTLAEALKAAFDTWKVPYYFVGDSAVFGEGTSAPIPVRYGHDSELLSVGKNNQNARIVTRIMGTGSKENVPYYYPNPTPKGELGAGGTAQGVTITDMLAFCQWVGLSDTLTYMGRDAAFRSIRISAGGQTDTQTSEPADAHVDNVALLSGKQWSCTAWLCTDLSGGFDGAIAVGLYANVGSADGIDPDGLIRHRRVDANNNPSEEWRKRSDVSKYGWDIVVDRVLAYLGAVGTATSQAFDVPYETVTEQTGIAPEDAVVFAAERIAGVSVKASEILSRLPSGADLSEVTVCVIFHLETHVYWDYRWTGVLPPVWVPAGFLAQTVQASLDSYEPRGWYVGDRPLGKTLAEVGLSMAGEPSVGDTITQVVLSKIPPTGVLMPSVYRSSGGAVRGYDALNGIYVNPDTQEYWAFEHEFDALEPHEHVEDFDDIKPSIKNLKDGQGQPLAVLTDVYFDDGYNTLDTDEQGNLKYRHFFVKLRPLGFNLFDCASENGEMEVVMSDGPCAGCRFKIVVTPDGKNPVQKNSNGTLKKQDGFGVLDEDNLQPSQQDTSTNAVWLALALDDQTFGGAEVEHGVMPSYDKNTGAGSRPLSGNAYTLGNINLPAAFYTAAEAELDNALIRFMAENNADKFGYNVGFSRVFLAQNPQVRSALSVRSSLALTYAGALVPEPLHVTQMTVSVKEGDALPDIRVEVSDIVEARTAGLDEKIAAAIDSRVVFATGSGLGLDLTDARYVRKDTDDTVAGMIRFDQGLRVGDYVPGRGGIGGSIYRNSAGEVEAVVDNLLVRRKAVFTQVEVDQMRKVAGTVVLSLADMTVTAVTQISGGWRCYFKADTSEGGVLQNAFAVGDQAMCQTFGGEQTHFYWRLVTAVGPDWIELSESDCAAGSDVPEVGDTIVQLGSRTDASRQSAQILSCYGELSPSYQVYAGINSYSLGGKDIFGVVYRETAAGSGVYEPHFFNYGSMLLGSRDKTQEYLEYRNGHLDIKGRLTVMNSQGAYVSMQDYMNAVANALDGLQRQVDGQTQSWASGQAPTPQTKPYPLWDEETQQVIGTANYPASGPDWDDDTKREKHFGDIYIDDTTGQGYRYTKGTFDSVLRYYWTRITDEEVALAMQLAQTANTKVDALDYLKAATNGGATLVSGGLILSNLIALGKTQNQEFKVWAGINGLRDTAKTGNGIAAWYGGEMMEKAEWEALTPEQKLLHEFAKSLFRFDGSGYLAKEKIYWNADGYGGIPGITWSYDQAEQRDVITIGADVMLESLQGSDSSVTDLINLVRYLSGMFVDESYVEGGQTKHRIKVNPNYTGLYSDGFISAGGLSQGGGQPAGNASLQLITGGGRITNGTDTLDVYSMEKVDEKLAAAGNVSGVKIGETTYLPAADKIVDITAGIPDLAPLADAVGDIKSSFLGINESIADLSMGIDNLNAGMITLEDEDRKILELFDEYGNARSALKLATDGPLSLWGVEYWNNGVPSSVTGRPNLYIARTRVNTSAANDTLLGIDAISNAASSGNTDQSRIVWDSEHDAWHFLGNVYADGFVSAGGLSTGGGQPAGNASYIELDGNGGRITNGTDYVDVFSREYITAQLAIAGQVKTVAGISPNPVGDIPLASLSSTLGLAAAAGYGVASTVTQGDTTHLVTSAAVWAAIDALPEPMIFKGSLGTGGTIQTLPAASPANDGYTYKVITAGTYAGQVAKIGDTFISTGAEWVLIPSGDEPEGTVTSVGISLPTGLTLASGSTNPITTSGTFAIAFATGYSIPMDSAQAAWSAKYDKPAGGIPNADLANKTVTIGNTTIALGGTTASLAGLASVTSSKFYLDADNYFEIVDGKVHLHVGTGGGFYTDGFISAGGLSTGGGASGVDLEAVWTSLANETVTTPTSTTKIHPYHIPDMANTYGYLKAESLSVSGGSAESGKYISALSYSNGIFSVTKATLPTYELPLAANGTRGGIQIGYTQTGKNYPVQLSSEKAYVYVPWTDTTYSPGTGITINSNNEISVTSNTYQPLNANLTEIASLTGPSSGQAFLKRKSDNTWVLDTTTYLTASTVPVATNSAYGGIKTGYTESAENYAVQLSSGKAFVHVADSIPYADAIGEVKTSIKGIDESLVDISMAIDSINALLANPTVEAIEFKLAGGAPVMVWDAENEAWHLTGNFYADGFVSAGGMSDGGGSQGIDPAAMWAYLKNTSGDHSYDNEKIATAHIPDMASTYGYIKSVALSSGTSNGTLRISVDGVSSSDVAVTGLGNAAYRGIASTIGASVNDLVSGSLLYGVLGEAFDATNTVKAFVNSSIATATATFRGTNTTATTEAAFLTWANALQHDLNDYAFWGTVDAAGNTVYKRYKYNGSAWEFEYNLNNSSFTAAQWSAINSGITATKVGTYDTIAGYFTNGLLQASHVGDLSGTYLPKTGGTMTGQLKIATGWGIDDATGNGMLCYHPSSWTGVSSSQWGVGAVDSQGVIRSSNSNLIHSRAGSDSTIYDSGNSNKSDVPWEASNLTLHGYASGVTNIDSSLYFDTTNSRVGIGTPSPVSKLHTIGTITAQVTFGAAFVAIQDRVAPGQGGWAENFAEWRKADKTSTIFNVGAYGVNANVSFVYMGLNKSYDATANVLRFYDTYLSYSGNIESTGVIHASTGIYSDGYVSAGGLSSSSDERLKTAIKDFEYSKGLLMSIRPREWDWNGKVAMKGHAAGFVAQEIEPLMSYAVDNAREYKALFYDQFHAIEISGLQDHERRIAELEKENTSLRAEIKELLISLMN